MYTKSRALCALWLRFAQHTMWEYQQRYNLVKLCFVSDPYVNVVLYRGSRASGQIDSTHTKVKKKVRSGIWNNLHWTVIVTLTSEVFSCKILNLRDITAECMHVVKKLMLLKLYICILSGQPHIFLFLKYSVYSLFVLIAWSAWCVWCTICRRVMVLLLCADAASTMARRVSISRQPSW